MEIPSFTQRTGLGRFAKVTVKVGLGISRTNADSQALSNAGRTTDF